MATTTANPGQAAELDALVAAPNSHHLLLDHAAPLRREVGLSNVTVVESVSLAAEGQMRQRRLALADQIEVEAHSTAKATMAVPW